MHKEATTALRAPRNSLDVRLLSGCAAVALVPLALLAFGVTLVMPLTASEHVEYAWGYALASALIVVALVAGLLPRLSFERAMLDERTKAIVLFAFALIVGVVWTVVFANYEPRADQEKVSAAAELLASGNFAGTGSRGPHGAQKSLEYMQEYPHQSGFVLYLTWLGAVVGHSNWIAFRLVNTLACAFGLVAVYRMSRMISERGSRVCWVFCLLSIPFVMLGNYIYGNTLGASLALVALCAQMRALQLVEAKEDSGAEAGSGAAGGADVTDGSNDADAAKDRRAPRAMLLALASVLSLAVAIWMKENSSVFAIAAAIVWVWQAIARRRAWLLAPAVATIVLIVLVPMAAAALFCSIAGVDIGSGTPSSVWIAMGLSESTRSPGWYSMYHKELLHQTNRDFAQMGVLASAEVSERLGALASDPLYALSFFGLKIQSMWAEPTYQSLWLSFPCLDMPIAAEQGFTEASPFASGLLNGAYVLVCDVVQTLVFAGAAFFFCNRVRRHGPHATAAVLAPALTFLGGFVLHLAWEGKTLYVIPYVMCLLPYAGAGIAEVAHLLRTKLRRGAPGPSHLRAA